MRDQSPHSTLPAVVVDWGVLQRFPKRIKDAVNRLSDFPLSGRAGRIPETRELVIPGTSYIAAYTIQRDEVLIAAVLHGRRNWPESLKEQAVTPQEELSGLPELPEHLE
ncbi:MAG TPA: type II toxin-antitoxin system RelE/ParE family toxin [Terracidiphilus sp.]|jgi:plasmid stabilization system protein ParE|nr:type II toxin-antitoxin system RelE/ParE family toxin [Terracidiphilus sp.]